MSTPDPLDGVLMACTRRYAAALQAALGTTTGSSVIGPAELIALSDERDQQLALRHDYYRWGWREGRRAGWREGYEAACAESERAWRLVADRVLRGISTPTYAELERLRYGPGGREHFGDPRPGDYRPGRRRARDD